MGAFLRKQKPKEMVKPECSYAGFDKVWKDMTGQRV